ncbi:MULTISPECIES: VOC family protein [Sphingobacterium]|uniref:VOC family protein n=1 Tax=Sphingobacterium tenebrionis TaxID=3111775 RepID=A0ABU8I8N3_9SPHI|nr:VOC family protein [Sphingobacterium sp. 1.A.4]
MSNKDYQIQIPVFELSRAIAFYKHVFSFRFRPQHPELDYAQRVEFEIPETNQQGILVQQEAGSVQENKSAFHFKTLEIEDVLRRVKDKNGRILKDKFIDPQTRNILAEFEDSEGNMISLHQIYPAK